MKSYKGLPYLDINSLHETISDFSKCKETRRMARNKLKTLMNDDFKCVECGAKEMLTIDHINGMQGHKHRNATAYKPHRCQTLCVKCHMRKNNGL